MEDSFISLSCPRCRTSLIETAVLRLGFFASSRCPYCGTMVRCTRTSMFLLLFGALILGTGAYCVQHGISLFADKALFSAIILGTGATIALLGLLITRFVEVQPRRRIPAAHYLPY